MKNAQCGRKFLDDCESVLERALRTLTARRSGETNDEQAVDAVALLLHSLAGNAAILGLSRLARVSAKMSRRLQGLPEISDDGWSSLERWIRTFVALTNANVAGEDVSSALDELYD